MRRVLSLYVPVAAGIALTAAAVFATQLGLDHNATWGARRTLLALGGIAVLALSLWYSLGRSRPAALQSARPSESDEALPQRTLRALWSLRLGIGSVLAVAIALTLYVFFVSAGTWTSWPETSRYYDDLASAFGAGRLDLNIKPSDSLLALPDPYEPSVRNQDPSLRAFVDQVWDLSFYQGKFYVYWGPVPALLVLAARLAFGGPMPDQFLVFGFSAGVLFFTALLLRRLRSTLFPDLPAALFLLSLLTAALAFPLLSLLGRAAIYEATIMGGQFFLMGGLYFAYRAWDDLPSVWPHAFLAATFWSLAAASRTNILLPAAGLTVVLICELIAKSGPAASARMRLRNVALVALPLLLGSALIGWYNWARFGSPLETGVRYTLTFQNLNRFHAEIFSAAYILPSLWMYLFTGFGLSGKFPYILIGNGQVPASLLPASSSLYHSEQISSLLLSAPVVLVSGVSLFWTASAALARLRHHPPSQEPASEDRLLWISILLWTATLLGFASILPVDVVQMRYFADFVPPLMLLCALGTWQACQLLGKRTSGQNLFVIVLAALCLASIALSLLFAFSADLKQFQLYNRPLLKELTRFLGP